MGVPIFFPMPAGNIGWEILTTAHSSPVYGSYKSNKHPSVCTSDRLFLLSLWLHSYSFSCLASASFTAVTIALEVPATRSLQYYSTCEYLDPEKADLIRMTSLSAEERCSRHLISDHVHSRRGSATSINSEDEDAIEPCPPASVEPQGRSHHAEHARPRPNHLISCRSHMEHLMGVDDGVDPSLLWQNMLAVQRAFGCYNSARMRAAVEMGGDEGLMPSKACLDLLNDSISRLPEDARRQVDDFLSQQSSSRRKSSSSWRRRFKHS